ncbi:MAG: nucleoside-triphosphatase [Candidatus Aminicenantes bacterium]
MIFILTGPRHSGKTSLLKRIVDSLISDSVPIDGFLSFSAYHNDHIIGYDLFDLKKQLSLPFIRKKGKEHWDQVGSYYFVPLGLAYAKEIISQSEKSSLLIVDELGPHELKGKGLWPELRKIISKSHKNLLLVVRKSLLYQYLGALGQKGIKIFDIEDQDVKNILMQALKSHIK